MAAFSVPAKLRSAAEAIQNEVLDIIQEELEEGFNNMKDQGMLCVGFFILFNPDFFLFSPKFYIVKNLRLVNTREPFEEYWTESKEHALPPRRPYAALLPYTALLIAISGWRE
jgi:hypothetical protein